MFAQAGGILTVLNLEATEVLVARRVPFCSASPKRLPAGIRATDAQQHHSFTRGFANSRVGEHRILLKGFGA